jgi:Ni,Fe-hydrogenase I cytochrome b subunit
MTFRRSRFAASRFATGPVRRGRFAAAVPLLIFFLATCYSYFSINLTKRRIFSVSCQCHLFINGLIASQRPRRLL